MPCRISYDEDSFEYLRIIENDPKSPKIGVRRRISARIGAQTQPGLSVIFYNESYLCGSDVWGRETIYIHSEISKSGLLPVMPGYSSNVDAGSNGKRLINLKKDLRVSKVGFI